jgi:hypothetical protein
MIFTRRALQRRLDELRLILAPSAVAGLAARLNRSGRDRMAAMWEVVVLHGLSQLGAVATEKELPSGRRPDISFDNGQIRFTADVTCVSDEGLDEANPYADLIREIEAAKTKLGLPIGGVDLRIGNRTEKIKGGERRSLRLPPRKRIREFVRDEIVPRLKEQKEAGQTVLRVEIEDDEVSVALSIDPSRGYYSTGGYAAYEADQLRGAIGMTGIIVGNGDCAIMRARPPSRGDIGPGDIASELLRQCSSIDFVLLLTIGEEPHSFARVAAPERWVEPLLVVREQRLGRLLETLFREMLRSLPKPDLMPINAALRAREDDYDIGHHGGYGMSHTKVRIGSREFTEILAGLRTIGDDGAKYVGIRPTRDRQPNQFESVVLRNLKAGRLPSAINVIHTGEDDDDDWIEIEFGEPDPAISPLT